MIRNRDNTHWFMHCSLIRIFGEQAGIDEMLLWDLSRGLPSRKFCVNVMSSDALLQGVR